VGGRPRTPRAHKGAYPCLIADTAARLIAECGNERVAVSDVAREAEVGEQTLDSYFPTQEQLVTDGDEQAQNRSPGGHPGKRDQRKLRCRAGHAKLQGRALASALQIIIDEAGRRTREGRTQAQLRDELYPMLERVHAGRHGSFAWPTSSR
jgi:AcrR family transcriptional regulator